MKRLLHLSFLLLVAAIIPACSKKPVEVTGQVFVVTKGRENIKMGAVEVLVIPDAEFQTIAESTLSWMQKEVRKEAQRDFDSEYMTGFIREVMAVERDASMPIPDLEKVRMSIVEESGDTKDILERAGMPDILTRSANKLISGATSTFTVTTDADGRFIVPITAKTWFIASGQREVGEETEEYLWVKSFEHRGDATAATLSISNESDIDSEDGLYSVLTDATGVSVGLEGFRKVEVSERMQSLVARHREAANTAKGKAEREAAEAKAKAELAAAGAKAKAEAAYAKFSGKRAGEEKVIEIAPSVNMAFCWCPAGKFTMGSPESEADRSDDERQVEVTLSQGFWMAKTEVTQSQWQAVFGENPSNFKGANRPVEQVSWDDAQEFLTKLNSIVGNSDGGKMALPTEAQWEYAAHAGEKGPYSGGTLDEVAWYSGNSGSVTHLVGTKKPNAWGLHDMHGNVREWCSDWYYDVLRGGVDPSGPSSGSVRVFRGGGWYSRASSCRAAYRFYFTPSLRYGNVGFRAARSSVP